MLSMERLEGAEESPSLDGDMEQRLYESADIV